MYFNVIENIKMTFLKHRYNCTITFRTVYNDKNTENECLHQNRLRVSFWNSESMRSDRGDHVIGKHSKRNLKER